MTTRSSLEDAVILNGIRYSITGVVESEYLPQIVEKFSIGPKSAREDSKHRNTIIWDGFQKGMLLRDISDLERDANHAFWAYAGIRTEGHTVLPPLATQTAAATGSPTSCSTLVQRAGKILGTFDGNLVKLYTQGSDSWGSTLDTLPAAATNAIEVRMGGTNYAVWATTTGYTYTADDSSFTDDTQDAKFLTFWDDRLWGITNGGQLWWSKIIGTEFQDAQLPLPDGSVQGLFVGRGTNAGRLVLYVSTTRGLYIHDALSQTFELVDPEIPEHQDNGLGTKRYLESTYYSAGLGVYRYINQPSQASVSAMGLDRRGGLQADHIGTITELHASHQELIAIVDDGSKEPGIYGWRPGESEEDDPRGYGAWQVLWDSAATGTRIDTGLVTTADGFYRFYWSYGGRINFITLPRDVINPLELSSYTYQAIGEIITPWLDGREISANKLAIQLFVNAIKATANETIVVDYAINDASGWTNLGTITTTGVTTYSLAAGVGVAFNRIRFRFTFARGGTDTNTPDLGRVEFHWTRPEVSKWRHKFTVKWEGNSMLGHRAEHQLDEIINAAGSDTLVDFTFRDRGTDDDGDSNPYNQYVKVINAQFKQRTGNDWTGEMTIVVEQV